MLATLLFLAATSSAPPPLTDVRTFEDVMQSFRASTTIRVVNVWATWCVPCVAEIGELQLLADKYRDRGVEVVGVSLDDAVPGDRTTTKQHLGEFLAKKQIRFRNIYFTGTPAEVADQFHFDGSIPITLVFDQNGREIARNEGKLDRPWFEKQLDQFTKRRSR